jgi:TonB family protein
MNAVLLYRQRGRWVFWVAFVSAIAIHVGAVALAKTKSPIAKLEHFALLDDVDIVYASEPKPPLLEELVAPPPLEEIEPDQDSFREENHEPSPVSARPYLKARPPSFVRETTASLRSVTLPIVHGMPPAFHFRSADKAMVAYAPRPVYPYEARRQRLTGSCLALLTVDQTSGNVANVLMVRSCDSAILDNSTLDALRRWRFKPGCVTRVQVPITYTLMGVSY